MKIRARFSVWIAILAAFAALMTTQPSRAQDIRETTSLKFVPADVAFYSASLRNAEQYQAFVSSRAFAKLKALPWVQEAMDEIKAQMESEADLESVKQFFEAPENVDLLKFLADAVSDEVFFFGDDRFGTWLAMINEFNNAMNMGRINALGTGEDQEAIAQAKMMDLVLNNPDLTSPPSSIVGFKIEDDERANQQLARLEAVLKQVLTQQAPQLTDRLQREQIGDHSFLTLKLDGSLVPWDQVLADLSLDEEQKKKLQDRLSQTKLVIAMGLWKEYLLICTGEDLSTLTALGTGDLLVDRKELAPLEKAAGKPVTAVSFISSEFQRKAAATDQQLNQMTSMIDAVLQLPMVPIAEDVKKGLQQDAVEFAKEVKAMIPVPGSIMGYTYRIENGYESLAYNWTKSPLDGSKPLTVLNHVGGSPIAYIAARRKEDIRQYDFAIKWTAKLIDYVERIAVPFLEQPEQRELVMKIKDAMTPLGKRFDEANRQKLVPAFADGQGAVVLDGRMTSESWMTMMPPAVDPLPFPEINLVYGVSDAKLLKEGFTEYFDILQAAIDSMSKIMPEQVPPFQLPPPASKTVDVGTIYSYATPDVAGLDKRIVANAGVSDSTMVLSLAPEATERLLKSQPLARDTELPSTDRPLASAFEFNVEAFVEMIRPWVDYGFEMAANQGSVEEGAQEQVGVILDVLSCFRTVNGISYNEDGALVTHAKSIFIDLDE